MRQKKIIVEISFIEEGMITELTDKSQIENHNENQAHMDDRQGPPERNAISDHPETVEKEILTLPEVADYLRVSRSTINRLIELKELPAFKIKGSLRFYRKEILQFIEKSRV